MSKMEFLNPKEAEKFKNKSGTCFAGHPVGIFSSFELSGINSIEEDVECLDINTSSTVPKLISEDLHTC